MRLERISALSFLRAAALAPLMVPGGQESALGQASSGVRAPGGSDSAWVVRQAREAQARFEWLRRQHLPVVWSGGGAACDEVVGRMCWYDDEPDWRPPPEPLEVEDGREELLLQLAAAAAQLPEDRWILGQRVRYLAEAGRFQEAARLAGECGGRPLDVDRAAEGAGAGAGAGTGAGAGRGEQAWWCAALLGFVRHTRGDFVAAESAFQRALAAMPSQRAQQWRDPALLLDREGRQALGEARGEERRRL
ncbi:MAG: hypothetical protein HY703_11785, partial [Gemmatimonadetes bacterium]|nr:hypothetical protein [Gemmatimonadota bacterium]